MGRRGLTRAGLGLRLHATAEFDRHAVGYAHRKPDHRNADPDRQRLHGAFGGASAERNHRRQLRHLCVGRKERRSEAHRLATNAKLRLPG